MRYKKIILIILGATASGLILFNVIYNKRTYQDEKYGFSFKYPRSWGVEERINEDLKEMTFYDRGNKVKFNLQNPYWYISEEVGDLIDRKNYSTNDPRTVLLYEVYDGFAPGQADSIIIGWQKDCLEGHCNMSKDEGGFIIMPLEDDGKEREKQIKELEEIIKSFKVIDAE